MRFTNIDDGSDDELSELVTDDSDDEPPALEPIPELEAEFPSSGSHEDKNYPLVEVSDRATAIAALFDLVTNYYSYYSHSYYSVASSYYSVASATTFFADTMNTRMCEFPAIAQFILMTQLFTQLSIPVTGVRYYTLRSSSHSFNFINEEFIFPNPVVHTDLPDTLTLYTNPTQTFQATSPNELAFQCLESKISPPTDLLDPIMNTLFTHPMRLKSNKQVGAVEHIVLLYSFTHSPNHPLTGLAYNIETDLELDEELASKALQFLKKAEEEKRASRPIHTLEEKRQASDHEPEQSNNSERTSRCTKLRDLLHAYVGSYVRHFSTFSLRTIQPILSNFAERSFERPLYSEAKGEGSIYTGRSSTITLSNFVRFTMIATDTIDNLNRAIGCTSQLYKVIGFIRQ